MSLSSIFSSVSEKGQPLGDKKVYTLLITSNRKAGTRKISVSSLTVKWGIGLLILVGVLIISMFVDYGSLLLELGENKRLEAENLSLQSQFETLRDKLDDLEGSLERVKNLSTKLKLITNVDSEEQKVALSMSANSLERANAQKENFNADSLKNNERSKNRPSIVIDEQSREIYSHNFRDYSVLSLRVEKDYKASKMSEVGIMDLWKALSTKENIMESIPNMTPVQGIITKGFGFYTDILSGKPLMHKGISLSTSGGTKILAPANGVVTYVGYDPDMGKEIHIDHGYGLSTVYGHVAQIFVELDQKVKRGDTIASVGTTGKTQGPQLFYEVKVNGVPVDPLHYILDQN